MQINSLKNWINSIIKKIEENYSVQDKQDALAMCALQISAKRKQSIITDNELMNELTKY